MPLITQAYIDRYTMRANPQRLYVFGDNLERQGFGGQAKEMRGEPNAIGLITKRRPKLIPGSFLKDADLKWLSRENSTALHMLRFHLELGFTVVWPEAGIGTGLADLQTHAPAIASYYYELRKDLAAIAPKYVLQEIIQCP